MLNPTILCEEHFGKPVLREAEAIKLARVPVNGDRLQDSILLHPRYIPSGVEHELFSARVYRRGRTVDLFLDEPIEIAGVSYGILNFKGVGADADDEMVIDTDEWYEEWSPLLKWIPRASGDSHGRVWGALAFEQGLDEFTAEIFHTYGIKHIPHVALNRIPRRVVNAIRRVCHGSERHDLAQLVRACKTNVRLDEDSYGRRPYQECTEQWIREIAEIDAALINAQVRLAKTGKMLRFIGSFAENRFIDGLFTDAENYRCDDFDADIVEGFLNRLVYIASQFGLIPPGAVTRYFSHLVEVAVPDGECSTDSAVSVNKLISHIFGPKY